MTRVVKIGGEIIDVDQASAGRTDATRFVSFADGAVVTFAPPNVITYTREEQAAQAAQQQADAIDRIGFIVPKEFLRRSKHHG